MTPQYTTSAICGAVIGPKRRSLCITIGSKRGNIRGRRATGVLASAVEK